MAGIKNGQVSSKNSDETSEINKGILNKIEELVGSPHKHGLDHLSFEEAIDIAQKKFTQFARIFYKQNADKIFEHSGTGYAGMSPETLQYIIYDNYIQSVDKKFDPNPQMNTMCTNGETVYMNPWFMTKLKPEEILFVLAHEINHIKLLHAGEGGRLNTFIQERGYTGPPDIGFKIRMMIANVVTDLIINDALVEDKIGMFPKDPETGKNIGVYIKGYAELTSEEGVIEFTNLLVQKGISEIPKAVKKELNINVSAPVIPNATTLVGAREATDKLIEFIRSISKDIVNVTISKSIAGDDLSEDEISMSYNMAEATVKTKKSQSRTEHLNDMVDSAINDIIQSVISETMRKNMMQGMSGQGQGKGQFGSAGEDQKPESGQGGPGSQGSGGLTDEEIEQIIEEMIKAIANGDLILGDHDLQEKLIKTQAKMDGMSTEELKGSIKEGIDLITEQLANNLVRGGVSMDNIKGLGHIGMDMYRVWRDLQYKPRRPYDRILTSLFEKINRGNQSATYAKYNRRSTVLNAANRALAKSGGYSPSTIIIPSKRSTSGKIVIAIDTSGSIFGDNMSMGMACSEIIRLSEILNQKSARCDIEVICCDTQIRSKEGPFKGGSPEMFEYIESLKKNGVEIKGGGGTTLLPVWEDMIKDGEEVGKMASGLIFITDTDTFDSEKIVGLYDSMKFSVPTVILHPGRDDRINPDFENLASRNPNFMLADIEDIIKQDKELGYDIS